MKVREAEEAFKNRDPELKLKNARLEGGLEKGILNNQASTQGTLKRKARVFGLK